MDDGDQVGVACASAVLAVIGGLTLLMFGWPLSYTTADKRSETEQNKSDRFSLLWGTLTNHSIVGVCFGFVGFHLLFSDLIKGFPSYAVILLSVVCALAWGCVMYWLYDTLGAAFLILLSALILSPLLIVIDHYSKLNVFDSPRSRKICLVFFALLLLVAFFPPNRRNLLLPAASAFIGAFFTIDGVISLVELGDHHWSMEQVHEDSPHSFLPYSMFKDIIVEGAWVMNHRRHLTLEWGLWIALIIAGLIHRRLWAGRMFCYHGVRPRWSQSLNASMDKPWHLGNNGSRNGRPKRNPLARDIKSRFQIILPNHYTEPVERTILLYRVVFCLMVVFTFVWLAMLFTKFVPDRVPDHRPIVGLTKPAPWHTYVFFWLFVFAECLGFPLSVLSALNMWRPVRRYGRLWKDCIGVPREKPWKWPYIDIFICHYNEDVKDSILTLKACMNLDWPKDRMHVYILDDGYFSKADKPRPGQRSLYLRRRTTAEEEARLKWWDDPKESFTYKDVTVTAPPADTDVQELWRPQSGGVCQDVGGINSESAQTRQKRSTRHGKYRYEVSRSSNRRRGPRRTRHAHEPGPAAPLLRAFSGSLGDTEGAASPRRANRFGEREYGSVPNPTPGDSHSYSPPSGSETMSSEVMGRSPPRGEAHEQSASSVSSGSASVVQDLSSAPSSEERRPTRSRMPEGLAPTGSGLPPTDASGAGVGAGSGRGGRRVDDGDHSTRDETGRGSTSRRPIGPISNGSRRSRGLSVTVRDRKSISPHNMNLLQAVIHALDEAPTPRLNTTPARRDCATGSHRADFYPSEAEKETRCKVSFIGRLKPQSHHAKGGNMNNALYNENLIGEYVASFDNDMRPHPLFLQACLPFFFPPTLPANAPAGTYWQMGSWGNTGQPKPLNSVAFTQAPQYFMTERDPVTGEYTNVRGMEGDDPAGHNNSTFFDAHQCGRDGFNLPMFAGTNVVFRRTALDSVYGIAYGTVTEDAFTGDKMHQLGWDSVYVRKDYPVHVDPLLASGTMGDVSRYSSSSADGLERLLGDQERRRRFSESSDQSSADERKGGPAIPRYFGARDDCVVHASLLDSADIRHAEQRLEDDMVAKLGPAGAHAGGVAVPASSSRRRTSKYNPDAVVEKGPYQLAVGLAPETNATSFGQRLRWAKGAFQIFMAQLKFIDSDGMVDSEWANNHPKYKPDSEYMTKIRKRVQSLKAGTSVGPRHMRKIFMLASTIYPFGGFVGLAYIMVAAYFMYSGMPPIATPGYSLLYIFLPYYTLKWGLGWIGNILVRNPHDAWRAQETWFSYAIIQILSIYVAIKEYVTGKAGEWASGGNAQGGLKMSPLEVPNIVFFTVLCIGFAVGVGHFLSYEDISAPWDMWAALGFGGFVTLALWPMVRKSILERLGIPPMSRTFRADLTAFLVTALLVVFVVLWQHSSLDKSANK